jgi:hypothetical protein
MRCLAPVVKCGQKLKVIIKKNGSLANNLYTTVGHRQMVGAGSGSGYSTVVIIGFVLNCIKIELPASIPNERLD